MNNVAIYPGTFDPITNGHIDIIKRASKLFEKIIVAVADNKEKSPLFSLDKRVKLATTALSDFDNIEVLGFETLLTDLLKAKDARVVIRGLRAVSDFEYEFQLAGMNRKLMPEIESLYLMPSEQYMFLSSSFVREVAKLNGDVSEFVPACVAKALLTR